jgi:hypothetical protein
MKLLPSNDHTLTAKVVLQRELAGADFDRLQNLLRRRAASWSSRLRLEIDNKVKVDLKQPGAVRAVAERETRTIASGRRLGGPAFVGAYPSLECGVSVDSEPIVWMRDGSLRLGNRISFVAHADEIEGMSAAHWIYQVFMEMVEAFEPLWGAVSSHPEYDAKVMGVFPSDSSTPGAWGAVGYDFGRALPGLFWINFFGPRYVELIGRERLLGAPAVEAREVGRGVLVVTRSDPYEWGSEHARRSLEDVLGHIGRQFFFSKAEPDAQRVAPDWSEAFRSAPDSRELGPEHDVERIVDYLGQLAASSLESQGEFWPFGCTVGLGGELTPTTALGDEKTDPIQAAELLEKSIRVDAEQARIRAAGICKDVRLRHRDGSAQDAIDIAVDLREGEPVRVIYRYRRTASGAYEFEEPTREIPDMLLFPGAPSALSVHDSAAGKA